MNRNTLKTIIYSGLFMVPFIPLLVSSSFFFPFITTKAFVWRIIIEIVFAAWAMLALIDLAYRPKKSPILYALLAFMIVIGIADLFGVAPAKSFWSNFERMEGYISLIHFAMFFLVSGAVFREIDWRRWWNTSLVASFIMVIYSFFQIAGSLEIHQGGARVDGTLGNASYLGVYLLIHIFIALMFLWRERKDKMLASAYGALVLLLTIILYHTATRGAILGLIGGLFLVAVLNLGNREAKGVRKVSVILLAVIIAVIGGFFAIRNANFVVNSPVLSRFASMSTQELKTGGRSFVWPMAIKGIKERPVLGWGQENFNYVFNEHYDPRMYALEPWFDRAHNIFLDWGIAGGLLGLLSYLSLYIVMIYLIWRRAHDLTHMDKALLTGLIAAYFFHNFFVFDQLVSYILFAAILAYAHLKSSSEFLLPAPVSVGTSRIALPVIGVLFAAILFFVNIKPIIANTSLIEAMKVMQTPGADKYLSLRSFRRAYGASRLGRPEVVEQAIGNARTIFADPKLSTAHKNEIFLFIKEIAVRQTEEFKDDARYQLLTGSFLTETGYFEEGLAYLNRAKALIPGKQTVYYEMGVAYINKGQNAEALKVFKEAYDLAPENPESKDIYLVGAIYAGDTALESKLRAEIIEHDFVFDDRIIGAYYNVGRKAEVLYILNKRIILDPPNKASYEAYIKQLSGQ